MGSEGHQGSFNRRHQVIAHPILQDKARRSQLECSFLDLVIIGSSDNNDARVISVCPHAAADLEPIDVGQAHIGHQYIRLKAFSGFQRISAGSNRADYRARPLE